MKRRAASLALLILAAFPGLAIDAGVARIDVTPKEPIRLTGYGNRRTNSVGVEQKLWAKALALGSDREGTVLLLTLDNCGIAEATYRELVARLTRKTRLKPGGIAIACSHTHSGPCTTDWAPNIFSSDIIPEQQKTIDRYTKELIDKLEQVGRAALKDRKPAQLSWAQGEVGFARNRRVVVGKTANFGDNAAGPVDHALPVLRVTDADGKLRALVANYACHCTTMGGEFNHIHGDWAGCAQEAIERNHPGATALITIGCGADANPYPRGTLDLARRHGDELAAEVKRLLGLTFAPLTGKVTTGYKEIRLPFGPQFTREQWQQRATNSGIVGYHAKKWLARLDRGEKPPDSLYYPINTWRFGDDLAMVFLPGEVVVDYALRLKKELDAQRLWVTAYANYVPCYIPSRRILAEGGYEAEGSLWYYDRPARISTNAEDLIIKTVHELVPKSFRVDPKKAEFPDPLTPKQALGTFRTKANFTVELVASEPLIASPVAIDWDARGRLWVCEMYDYPTGMTPPPEQSRKWGEPIREPPGGFTPGGRIKILTSSKGDGRYDKATLFLDKLSFPTGVFPWRNGALICAAPDILYAEDTNGDFRADIVRTNFTGFATHNYQARVNGFRWGLDGWLHGSSGLFGGKIKSLLTGKEVDLGGRDFRVKPDTGEIEPLAGISQFGRVRDDFDNWVGNDNSTLLWHYPLAERYMRRNPYVAYPEPRVNVAERGAKSDIRNPKSEGNPKSENRSAATGAVRPSGFGILSDFGPRNSDFNRIFPISRTLERFNHPESANRVTSACGIDIYRDNLLGAEYYGNAFICEPVHNLVTRLVLEPDGVTFAGRRADDEQRGEFLASTDNWFRPVQVRTGPDGALWVVDMYRFVIEHPRWISAERLKTLDVRAGADMGRIYRVYPKGAKLRPIRDLTKLDEGRLAEALDTPNGTTRDLTQSALLDMIERPLNQNKARGNALLAAQSILQQLVTNALIPAVRVQAATVLGFPRLPISLGPFVERDPHPEVRRQALRLAEVDEPDLILGWPPSILSLTNDSDARVRFQLALALASSHAARWGNSDPQAAEALAALAREHDAWMRAAVRSSAVVGPSQLIETVMNWPSNAGGRAELLESLVTTAVGMGNKSVLADTLAVITPKKGASLGTTELGVLRALLEALQRKTWPLDYLSSTYPDLGRECSAVRDALARARTSITNNQVAEDVREAAIRLTGLETFQRDEDAALLYAALTNSGSPRIQRAAKDAFRRQAGVVVPKLLLSEWSMQTPALRSVAFDVLSQRDEWLRELVSAVENGAPSPAEVPLSLRQRLLKQTDASLRNRAVRLFTNRGPPNRGEVLAKFESVSGLAGVSDRGATVFDKNCAQCHAWRGRGHAVGPNLAEYAGKGVADFVQAILDPNSAINPNYLAYTVETKDGRSLTGIVRGETASGLTLVQGGGVEEKLLRADIAEIRASALSLMPEGLEQALSPQDMADLIAWLKQGAPAPFGTASANAELAARNRADFLKSGASSVVKVVSAAETLPYRSWIGTLPLAYCRQSAGVNRLTWEASPFTPALSPSEGERRKGGAAGERTAAFRFPAAMGFLSQPQGKFTLHLNGKPALDFDVSLTDAVCSSADGRVRMSYAVAEANSEDSNGPLLIEVDAALLEAGKAARFEVTGSESGSQRWFGLYQIDR